MSRLRTALAASAAMAAISVALPAAADGPSPIVSPSVYEPAPLDSADDFWAGMYAGLFFGMGASSHELFIDIDGSDRFTHTEDGIGGTGMIVGARVGYDFRLGGSGIIGFGLDGAFGDIASSSTSLLRPGSGGQLEVTHELSVESLMSLTGRFGHLVNDNTMLYGLAGWSTASVSVNANYSDSTGNFGGVPGAFSVSDDISGATFGLGMETRLGDRTTLGVEYRYTDLESMTIYDPVGFTQVQMPSTQIQTITAGVNVRF